MAVKDILVSASVAVGNVASRERDRDVGLTYDDGRPRPMAERAEGRVKALATEGIAKVAVSQGAHYGVRELAKRVNQETLKKVLGQLSKSPAASAGAALFAFDIARDGFRFARGRIDGGELAERVGGNAVGLVGAGTGAYVGSFVGTLAMPVIGTAIGSVVGGVIGGIGGDTYGRRKVRDVLGLEDYDDDFDDDDYDDD
jgi:phage tail tape-measure protein